MTPQKAQHVQCLLRVGGMVEGFVETWSNAESILKSLDGKSIIIIPTTSDDIMLVKIILPELTVPETKNAIKEKLDEVLESDGSIKASTLEELRHMAIEQDKKIVTEKIKEHHLGGVKKVTYGLPTFTKNK